MKPFTITIPDAELSDLTNRLSSTRWADELNSEPWKLGPDVAYMKGLIDYWHNQYDWRAQERLLNQYPQFVTELNNTSIHFVHVPSNNPAAQPLLLLHGWPDSFYRFYKLIPLLTEHFHLVIPSIPGFGFSSKMPLTPSEIGALFAALMQQLGYKKYMVHGGDVGSIIARSMISEYPEIMAAAHLTDVGYPHGTEQNMTEAEQQFASDTLHWGQSEGAYLKIQVTKPQTLGFSLNNSPAALAAWAVSMVHGQANDTTVDEAFGGRDALITNLMLYWFTQTSSSAAAFYERIVHEARTSKPAKPNAVPVGIALFPRELQFPEEWADRSLNVTHFRQMPRGGHFAALEEPELLADAIIAFAATLRKQ